MKIIKTLAAVAALAVSSMTTAAPVNINTANATEISEALNGVGMVKAQAIIDYRDTNGLFTTGDQVVSVGGIGESTYNKNKEDILVQ